MSKIIFRDHDLFKDFVGAIEADGGEDAPEDVMGGLKMALNELSWRPEACKVCIWKKGPYVAFLAT